MFIELHSADEMNKSLNNYTNGSYEQFVFFCESKKTFTNFDDFIKCYNFFASENLLLTIFEWSVAGAATFFNSLVVISLIFESKRMNCFDKVLVGFCLVDGITGIVDIPLFHIGDIFGYWPLGSVLGNIWSIYDNNININTSAHMLYASYARLRSLQNPKNYQNELLLRYPFIVMALIWIVSLGIWVILLGIFGIVPYSLIVDFRPFYWTTISNLLWFFLLIAIFVVAVMIYLFLHEKAKRDKLKKRCRQNNQSSIICTTLTPTSQLNQTTNASVDSSISRKISCWKKKWAKYRLPAEKKFLIIMGSYWFQWFPPCIMVLISPFVYIPSSTYTGIYWLTYTVCVTDPICVLLLNPNIRLPRFNAFKRS